MVTPMQRETMMASVSELRFSDDAGTFTGYAAVWDQPDTFGDTIKQGAFAKTIAKRGGRPVAMLWSHDPSRPIGVWSDLVEDHRGLKVSGRLVLETAQGREAHALLIAKAIDGLSIGFRAISSERGPNGGRRLTQIELVEISLVVLPAASKARVTSVKHDDGTAGLLAFTRAAHAAAISIRGISNE